MARTLRLSLVVSLIWAGALNGPAAQTERQATPRAVLDQYCVSCTTRDNRRPA